MILGTIRRILREDLARSGELPKWIEPFLSPLNEFIEKVVLALTGRLTFKDNFRCKVYTGKFASGTPKEVSVPVGARVFGILAVEVLDQVITGYGFDRKANGNLSVTITHDGSGEIQSSVVILLE
jgi:hypothetical protein